MDLLLASTSPIRTRLLQHAGVVHESVSPDVEEASLKAVHSGTDEELATALAEAKALSVSRQRSDAWVIGSDSIVSVSGRRFSKPASREEAAEHLRYFSDREMVLTSAVALTRAGEADWSAAQEARLQVRHLSEEYIGSYLDGDWPEVSYCVGVFRLEGPGVQLFDRIDGDHFAIQGLPLLPLLGALRERGILQS